MDNRPITAFKIYIDYEYDASKPPAYNVNNIERVVNLKVKAHQ